jgi:hypothetical protein
LPIRVTFDDRDNVQLSLIEAKSLKDSVKFKSVFFSKDLTQVQIVQLKQLKKQETRKMLGWMQHIKQLKQKFQLFFSMGSPHMGKNEPKFFLNHI